MTRMPNIVTLKTGNPCHGYCKMVEHEVDCIPVVTRRIPAAGKKAENNRKGIKTGIIL